MMVLGDGDIAINNKRPTKGKERRFGLMDNESTQSAERLANVSISTLKAYRSHIWLMCYMRHAILNSFVEFVSCGVLGFVVFGCANGINSQELDGPNWMA
jgi:hypothetical protein